MKSFLVCVVYPVYLTIEAENEDEAQEKALSAVDEAFELADPEPIIQSCVEAE